MSPVKILHVNTHDQGGGAAQLAYDLMTGCTAAGHRSWLAVRETTRKDARVYALANFAHWTAWAKLCHRVLRPLLGNRLSRAIGRPANSLAVLRGHEDFDFPGSRRLILDAPEKPDLIHLHNLHGAFFDLRILPALSRTTPTFLTLHDAWMLSGHCSHSFGCERWRAGCGACPDLTIYPAVRRDATSYNWRRKREIYSQSRLHIAAPCHWLADKLWNSMLAPAIVSTRVIPHGIDLVVFNPSDQRKARRDLALPEQATILLFTSKGIRGNFAKDYTSLRKLLEILGARLNGRSLLFLALGDEGPPERFCNIELRFVPHLSARTEVARYYNAADIYVHPARAEVWGLSITEAMACGLPVVASRVGGISDQILDGENGYLIGVGDSVHMANRIEELINDRASRRAMGCRARERAQAEFGLEVMTNKYLNWYYTVLGDTP